MVLLVMLFLMLCSESPLVAMLVLWLWSVVPKWALCQSLCLAARPMCSV
jgi:hypothetical protein